MSKSNFLRKCYISTKRLFIKSQLTFKRLVTPKTKLTDSEKKLIEMVKGIVNNPTSHIHRIQSDKYAITNGKVYILIDYGKIDVVDDDKCYESDITEKVYNEIQNIILHIICSRIRQVERMISSKKNDMIEVMLHDAKSKEDVNGTKLP